MTSLLGFLRCSTARNVAIQHTDIMSAREPSEKLFVIDGISYIYELSIIASIDMCF